jgi:tungstate transport system substrate-binding protein
MYRVALCVAAALVFASTAFALPEGSRRLRLATTTSVENSGLLAHLLPTFEQRCACDVDVIPVGTGQALKLGSGGDVDVVIVHAPDLEEEFVKLGHGVDRRTFMANDFVVVGPVADPAGIRGSNDVVAALTKIAGAQQRFISRGDQSGTHYREVQTWGRAGIHPEGDWYLEAGQGMGAVLTMAANMPGYTLTDRGTFLSRADKLGLEVLASDDPTMVNPYSVIPVNPERHEWVDHEGAVTLSDWLCGEEGQRLIGEYRVGGEALFQPTAPAP